MEPCLSQAEISSMLSTKTEISLCFSKPATILKESDVSWPWASFTHFQRASYLLDSTWSKSTAGSRAQLASCTFKSLFSNPSQFKRDSASFLRFWFSFFRSFLPFRSKRNVKAWRERDLSLCLSNYWHVLVSLLLKCF